ncbi:MAG: 1,6-anhydro-N-acetylmuramyl-L-alanine amidase AmpD [Gammaproteobacteria bacterium]|nr:1,6-anhydro-N-acetylmuramyl-L-alanine amidase AmpD [Gammaproteobacteria bacterium]
MRIDDGRLSSDRVNHKSSPFCDERPEETAIDLIVIHGISLPRGVFEGEAIDALFMGCLNVERWPELEEICGLRVSAHVLIRRDGSVVQYVPFDRRAWHAGESSFKGRSRCNDFSVGIELEGCDDIPYETAQYKVLAEIIGALRADYPAIGNDSIVGHCDIAPGRKTDPGEAFDWARLRKLLG